MNWDDLRVFLAVARSGSVRGAANALKVNQSTVSRRVAAFEKSLGSRLFEKLPTGLELTATGRELLLHAQRVETEIQSLDRHIFSSNTDLAGSIRLTLSAALATHLLMDDLADFSKRYPEIALEISASDTALNLSKREADVAIRITNTPPDYLVGRRLAYLGQAIYASRDYMQSHSKSGELHSARWLGWGEAESFPQWVQDSPYPHCSTFHQMQDVLLQLQATISGMGVAMLPCFMADPIDSLIKLPGPPVMLHREVWILTHRDIHRTAKVNLFTRFITERIRAHKAALEGSSPS